MKAEYWCLYRNNYLQFLEQNATALQNRTCSCKIMSVSTFNKDCHICYIEGWEAYIKLNLLTENNVYSYILYKYFEYERPF